MAMRVLICCRVVLGKAMRRILVMLAVLGGPFCACHDVSAKGSDGVRDDTTTNGTFVASRRATNPNSTIADNWSTKGNVNPYTGQPGTKSPSK